MASCRAAVPRAIMGSCGGSPNLSSLALDAQKAGFTPLAFLELGTFLMLGAARLESPPRGLRYLIHPEGMGAAFHVLVLGKGVNPADWAFEHNRLYRLGL